jgi:hypothetical protein
MAKLNCQIGDLAITVKADMPESLGVIVKINGVAEIDRWWGFKEPMHLWEVEVVCKGSYFCCRNVDKNMEDLMMFEGYLPDAYLKAITPPPEVIAILKNE